MLLSQSAFNVYDFISCVMTLLLQLSMSHISWRFFEKMFYLAYLCFVLIADLGSPTSIDFVRCDTSQVVVGYTSADAVVYDLETGKPILTLDGRTLSGKF